MNRRINGTRIRETRRKLRMTQSTVAELAAINQSHVSRLEQSRRGARAATIGRIAAVLKVPVEDLLVKETKTEASASGS